MTRPPRDVLPAKVLDCRPVPMLRAPWACWRLTVLCPWCERRHLHFAGPASKPPGKPSRAHCGAATDGKAYYVELPIKPTSLRVSLDPPSNGHAANRRRPNHPSNRRPRPASPTTARK
jgi:hypothetical protein